MVDQLNDEEFCSWVKSVIALDMTKSPLREFVEPIIVKRHTEIIKKLPEQRCVRCNFNASDICECCKQLKREITKDHRYKRPTFDNTYVKDCLSNPWELAKCYMAGGYANIHDASNTDIIGFLQVIINNVNFQSHTSTDLGDKTNVFYQVKDVRNEMMHSAEHKTTKQKLEKQTSTIINMLESLHTESATRIIPKVKQLKHENISLEDIRDANSEAVKFFKSYELEIKERIKECEHRIEETEKAISDGEKRIKDVEEDALFNIQDETEKGKKSIQELASREKEDLLSKQKKGLRELEDQTSESSRILDEKKKLMEKDLNKRTDQLSQDIKQIRAEKTEAWDKAKHMSEEIVSKVDLINEKTNENIDGIEDITRMCMEKICSQTEKSSKAIQDVESYLGQEFLSRMRDMVEKEIASFESLIEERKEQLKENDNPFIDENTDKGSKPKVINVKYSSESDCCITGMVIIDTTRMAIVDHFNASVKIIDISQSTIDDRMEVSGWPLDITYTEDKLLVVLCEQKLLFLHFDGRLHANGELDLNFDSNPKGVVSINECLAVSFSRPDPCVRKIDIDGKTLQCFTTDLNNPSYITTDKNKTAIYVADTGTQCIHNFNLTEQESHGQTDKVLQYPSGLTVDQNSNVYVADKSSHSIYQISPGGHFKEIINRSDMIESPGPLVYCGTDNRLYIGCKKIYGKKNLIVGYEISY